MPDLWNDHLLDVVLSPALWLSIILALAYAVLFTVWRGGRIWQFLRDLVAALVGFGAGHLVGIVTRLGWLRVGDVQLFWGTLGAAAALLLGRRFWWPRPPVASPPIAAEQAETSLRKRSDVLK